MNIFEDDDDRAEFLRVLGAAFKARRVEVYAWCLMSNHVHLVVRGQLESISDAMKAALGPYAKFFNQKHDHVGHLFQGRFTSVPVLDDVQLMETVRYVHQNPSAAGICGCGEYPWSSYGAYVGSIPGGASLLPCATELVLELFDGRDAFGEYHGEEGDVEFEERERQVTGALSEAAAKSRAEDVLGPAQLAELSSKKKAERDACLSMLKEAGLSVRQIERITGIGRNIIQRASRT